MIKRVLQGIFILIASAVLVACGSDDPNVLPNDPPSASNVIIIDNNGGAAIVGDTLSGAYDYSDREGNDEGKSTFRWLRNGNPIAGATTINYTLVAADSGQSITFEVTPVAELGGSTGKAVISSPIVINSAPTASSVAISAPSAVYVGYTLTGTYVYNDADGDAEGTTTFRWLRNGSPISGATSTSYLLVAADSGQSITFEVRPVALTGMRTGLPTVSANAVTVLNSAPVASSVSITDDNGGIPLVGDSLTGSFQYSDVDNDPQGISTYRWLRDGSPISGETASTYVLSADDSGAIITFEVTPVAATGFPAGLPAVSGNILVGNSAPVANAVSISDNNGGNALVGDTLTGNYNYSDVDGDPQGISTYRWLRNGSPITGATTTSYTLIAADSGSTITFQVTPVAAAGTTPGVTVTSSGVVVVNSAPVASAVSVTDGNGGEALVGDTLTGNYTYSDADNDPQGTSTYRWLRNGAAIAGATSTSYTLVAADTGTTIRFEVTPVAASGTTPGSAVASSGIVVANSAPTATAVNITDNNGGDAVVGDTLTGNYTFNDADNDAEGTSTYRWLRNGSPIAGATTISYTLLAADSGTTITFEVTPVAASGNSTGSAVTSTGILVANSAPTASAVSITDNNGNNALVGDTLTGNYTFNDVDNDPEGASTYRWLRNGTAIPGATAISYTLVTADTGSLITFEVTPVAASGVASGIAVISTAISVFNSAPTASAVIISDSNGGDVLVGDTLNGSYSYNDVDNDLEGTSTYRWLRNGLAITGATSTSYTLVTADSGTTITFEVTPIAVNGITTGSSVTSNGTGVSNSAPIASAVSVTDNNGGNALVGDTLTGSYSYSDADNNPQGSSTFRWLRNGTAIGGATTTSYTLVTADSGNTITFEVTPVATSGTSPGSAATSNGIVVSNSAPVASAVSITDNNGGNVLVGDTLTGTYSYSDVDNDPQGASSYRWLRNSVAIAGATSINYTLVAADTGAAITFEVTPVAASGNSPGNAVTSNAVNVLNSAPTASAVSINDGNGGNALVGDTLTGSYSYSDADNDPQGSSTFRWLRNGTAIGGATAVSYTLVTADSGATIAFEVTPVAITGTSPGSAVASSGIVVANSAPTATAVSITDNNGTPTLIGDSLTGIYTYVDPDGDSEGASTFRWLRNGSTIAGATTTSYTLSTADTGATITFEVTPAAAAGVTTGAAVTSGGIVVANSAPTASAVSITDNNGGSALVGDTLTGNYSFNDVDGDAEGTSTYRWLRNGTAIGGATAINYTLVTADSGASVTFEVTPVADTGTTTGPAVVSSGITIANSSPTATGVSITDINSGDALVGDTLTGNYNYSDADNDPQGSSTYRWLRNGTAIGGATAINYTLIAADSGATITFEVTPVASVGASPGNAVTSAGLVVANSAPVASAASITDNSGGNALVGDTLTGNYNYSDADNDPQGTSTFRWLRNGTAIGGATAINYTLIAADSGATITFEVTPVASVGASPGNAVTSTGLVVANSAPTATGLSITDTNGDNALVGDTLTGGYSYSDADNDPQGTSTYRWLRNGTAIGGATTTSYTLVTADSGTTITFEVTPVASVGTSPGNAVTSAGLVVANSAPTASAVSISDGNGGEILVGDILTGNYNYSDADNDPQGTSTYRWLRNGAAIAGATAATYTLVSADSGATITFEVTPVATTGTTTGTAVVSAGIIVANSAPTATGLSITDTNGGNALVGDTLTGGYSYSDADNDPQGTSTFRWLRNGTAIGGATTTSYTLVTADSGATITFEVTPIASAGTSPGNAVTSAGLVVANSAPTATGLIITDTNGGNALVGDTLTGSYSYSDADNNPQGTSTFRWLRNGTAIAGATTTSYTLVTADSGNTITFEVTPVASVGTSPGNAVTSGGIVVANSAPTATALSISDSNGGQVLVGDTLTGIYNFNDVDNDSEGTSTYRWLRNGTAIGGATTTSYTLVTADSGTTITFEVTPVASAGIASGTAVTSTGILVANSAPVASAVIITDNNGGDALVGDTLTGSYNYSDADNDPQGTSSYRWLRNGTAIAGATAATYTLVTADSGATITFEVTPVATAGMTTGAAATSTGITIVNSAPVASAVIITDNNGGNALVGDTLTGSYNYSDADNNPQGTSTFRWLRNGTAIGGATTTSYTLITADSGTTITFEVTPVASVGTSPGNAVTSVGLVVSNSAPTATALSITDTNGSQVLVGDTLTGIYTFNDVDNDSEGTSTFRWLRNGSPIASATAVTYTLASADSGATITFEVTPVAATGVATGVAVVSAGIVVANSAPTATALSITDTNGGNPLIGDTLTGSYSYSDADNDPQGSSTFRWLRNGSAIPGATSTSYVLVTADTGTTITFEVTPVATTGTITGNAAVSSGLAVSSNTAPTASSVSITDDNNGNAEVGDSLTGNYTYNDTDGDAEGVTTFRWLRNGAAISGASSSTYTLVSADTGNTITFEVTPVALSGVLTGTPVTSSGLTVANSAPTASAVIISDTNGGDALVGDSLAGSYDFADADGDLEGTSTFRWLRNGAAISGATSSSYTLVTADSGTAITFEVTPVAATGTTTGTAATSAGISVINSAPSATAVAIIDDNGGTAFVGESLTGDYTFNDADDDLEGTSTFRWLRNGAAISGATSISYTLVTADAGTTITFEVTPVAATGSTTGTAVVSTGVAISTNAAPSVSAVSISDGNSGSIVVGDVLTGNYTFNDSDGDSEGTSTFRWLRDSIEIGGATASTYTLVTADSGTTITFEVTPVSATGVTTGAAVVSGGVAVVNSAPTVIDVSISDDNNDNALVGDDLTGSYTFEDVDDDAEGASTFRWLRNGTAIDGATASTYTLVAADVPALITFEVTPVAATGILTGTATVSAALPTGNAPVVSGYARYLDSNLDGSYNANDQLVVPFDQPVDTNTVTGSAFDLPVNGDGLGSGATVQAGPANNEVTIVLGTNPKLTLTGDFSIGITNPNSPSGIDVDPAMLSDAIESLSDIDAIPSQPIDLIPGFVDSNQSLGSSNSQSIALGDVNGDTYPDIVVANAGTQANQIYLNSGTGSFSAGATFGTNDSQSIVLANIDGNPGLDIIVANASGQGNRVYTNDGTGTFTDSGQSLGLSDSQSIAVGDVDGDTDLDIVFANAGSQANQVYLNDGFGIFSPGATFGTNDSQSIVLANIDGNPGLDIIVANASGQGNRVYTNDGTGTFTDSGQSLGLSDSQAIAVGDVDGDTDLDIVFANAGTQANQVYLNNGSGIFSAGATFGNNDSQSIVLDDVDGDSDLDIIVANASGEGNQVYLNNGSGNFTDSGQSLGSNNSQSIAVGDVDGDGDNDLAVSNAAQGNRVYLGSLSDI